MALVDGGQLMPTPHGMQSIMLLDGNGTITRFRERINNVINASPIPVSNSQYIYVGRRQTVTKLTFTGDTVWHTVVPPRYPNRQWDANSLAQDSQGNIVVLATSTESVLQDTQMHLTRLRPSGQLLQDTMLYRAPNNYGRSLLLAPGNELVIDGYTSSGQYGNSDLFLVKFSPFRTVLAARAGSLPLAGGLACYPNPSAGSATVRAVLPAPAGAGAQLGLYDALGRACAEVPVGAGASEVAVPVAGLPPGLYLLRLRLPDGRTYSTKLLRE